MAESDCIAFFSAKTLRISKKSSIFARDLKSHQGKGTETNENYEKDYDISYWLFAEHGSVCSTCLPGLADERVDRRQYD